MAAADLDVVLARLHVGIGEGIPLFAFTPASEPGSLADDDSNGLSPKMHHLLGNARGIAGKLLQLVPDLFAIT